MPESNPHVRYESHDVPVRSVIWFAFAIAGLIGGASLAADYVLTKFRGNPKPNVLPADLTRTQLPRDLEKIPAPRLQISDVPDLRRLRKAEDEQLETYGWIDAEKKIARIPIAEAMRRLAVPETAEKRGIRIASKKGESP